LASKRKSPLLDWAAFLLQTPVEVGWVARPKTDTKTDTDRGGDPSGLLEKSPLLFFAGELLKQGRHSRWKRKVSSGKPVPPLLFSLICAISFLFSKASLLSSSSFPFPFEGLGLLRLLLSHRLTHTLSHTLTLQTKAKR